MLTRKEYYRAVEKEPGHFRLGSAENVWIELFIGTDRALLFDTGNGFGDIHAAVRKLTDKPLIIVNSHGHGDHTGGNAQFAEECLLLPEDFKLCQKHCSKAMRREAMQRAEHSFDFRTGRISDILPEDFDESAYLSQGTGKIAPLSKDQVFDLGNFVLRVVWMPGHTKGCIGLLDEKRKVLYAGDSLSSFIWLFLDEAAPLSDYRAMLARSEKLPFDHFYSAHDEMPHDRKTFEIWKEMADQVDFEKGISFDSPINADGSARICVRKGYGPQDFAKEGYAAVVIDERHLR